jgi:hypothetical protein
LFAGHDVTFSPTDTATTTATFGHPGTYTIRVAVSDGQYTGISDVIVVVNPQVNRAPTVSPTATPSAITLPSF